MRFKYLTTYCNPTHKTQPKYSRRLFFSLKNCHSLDSYLTRQKPFQTCFSILCSTALNVFFKKAQRSHGFSTFSKTSHLLYPIPCFILEKLAAIFLDAEKNVGQKHIATWALSEHSDGFGHPTRFNKTHIIFKPTCYFARVIPEIFPNEHTYIVSVLGCKLTWISSLLSKKTV